MWPLTFSLCHIQFLVNCSRHVATTDGEQHQEEGVSKAYLPFHCIVHVMPRYTHKKYVEALQNSDSSNT